MRAFCMLVFGAFAACGDGAQNGDAGNPDASDAASDVVAVDSGPKATTIAVLDGQGTSIVTFPLSASGDVAPLAAITGLSNAGGLAVDAQHFLYVTTSLAILVFAPGASGAAAPVRTIAGPTALASTDQFASLAVAPDGTIYAGTAPAKILVFAPGANGDVAPLRTIAGPTTTMQAVLSVSYFFTGFAVADATQHVLFFSNAADGDVAPKRTLNDGAGIVTGASFDDVGALYLARYEFGTSTVLAYIAGAQANATPLLSLNGAATQITAAGGVAVDDAGNVYVTNADPAGAAVLVFDGSATGNVAPVRTLKGPSTTLAGDASQFPMPIVVW